MRWEKTARVGPERLPIQMPTITWRDNPESGMNGEGKGDVGHAASRGET